MTRAGGNQPELFAKAANLSIEAVRLVDDSMLELSTPCTDWNVRQLINHMAITCRFSAAIMDERPPAEDRLAEVDVLGDDYKAAYAAIAGTTVQSFRAPGALEREIEAPPGRVSGAFWAAFPTWDLYVHTWDLVTATGIAVDQPDELTEPIMAWAEQIFFGGEPPNPANLAADAPAIDRLVALFGRSV